MKKILALELATALTPSQSAIRPERQDTIAERVFTDCWVALKDTLSCIDRATMESAATAIARCESLYLFGAGGSAHIAQEAALKFLFLGFRTLAFVDPMQQLAAARVVTPRDVAIAVTYSGNQPEVAEALKSAHDRRAFCVCITSFEQSLVSKSADTLLLISIPSETFRGQTGAHRVAQIAILDALAVWAGHLRTARMKNEKRSRVLRSLSDQINRRTGR